MDNGEGRSWLFDFPREILSREIFHRSLDFPSQLALSLTCRLIRYEIWNVRSGEFDSFRFMEDCARLGYLKLLKLAVDLRADFDGYVIFAAVRANQTETALFLYEMLRVSSTSEIYKEAAINGNRALLAAFPGPFKSEHENKKLAALYAARGGFIDLALELAESNNNLIEYAAEGGNMDHVLKAIEVQYRDPHSSAATIHQQNMEAIFRGACKGGHLSLIKYALEYGTISTNYYNCFIQPKAVSNPEILAFIIDIYPSHELLGMLRHIVYALLNSPKFFESFKVLLSKLPNVNFDNFNICRLPQLVSDTWRPESARVDADLSLRLLLAVRNYQLTALDLTEIIDWATLDQFKYYFSLCTFPIKPSELIDGHLERTRYGGKINLDNVLFLAKLAPLSEDVIVDLFDRFSFELKCLTAFDRLYEIIGQEAFASASSGISTAIAGSFSTKSKYYFDSSRNDVSLSSRVRLYSMISIVKWLVDKKVKFSAAAKRNLYNVKSKFFEYELDKIL